MDSGNMQVQGKVVQKDYTYGPSGAYVMDLDGVETFNSRLKDKVGPLQSLLTRYEGQQVQITIIPINGK